LLIGIFEFGYMLWTINELQYAVEGAPDVLPSKL
jgi:hypothetical protein